MTILSFDIETKSPVDLLKHGVYNYVNSQFFQILWLSYSINYGLVKRVDLTKDPIPQEFLTLLFDPNCVKRAANATFERICFSKVLGRYLPPEEFECTLVLAGRNGLPMSLGDAALRAGVASQKAASGDHLIKMFSIPVQQTKDTPVWKQWVTPQDEPLHWENYGKYNAIDVYAEMDVQTALQDMPVPTIEHTLYGLDQRINDRGVLLDRQLASQAQRIGAIFKEQKTQEIIALTGIKNPNSVKQLIGWLNEEAEMQITTPGHLGIEGEVVKFGEVYGRIEKLPKQAVVKILSDMPSAKTQQVLEARLMLGKASVAKYKKMNEMVCCDSRIRGMLAFYGAHTGRWAGRGLQPQNFTKHKTKEIDMLRELIKSGDMVALAAKFPDIPDALSQAVRTAFIAKPGHEFLVSDYAAIEARVTAWLAGEWWLVDFFEKGKGDVYVETAARMFNLIAETIDKETYEGNEIRQRGKMAMLALGFGGAVGALTNMCNAYGVYIAEQEKKPIVEKFRQAHPNIVKFWDMLEWAALQALLQPGIRQYVGNNGISYLFHKGNLYCSLPSGRWMCYREARIGENRWGGAAIRYKQSKGRGAWFEVDTFGGKLAENCLTCDTEVLTDSGWLKITEVKKVHKLWDGVKWVSHDGLIDKGIRQTIRIDGVGITPDHLILTDNGWKTAKESKGFYREESSWNGSREVFETYGNEKCLANPMSLREPIRNADCRVQQRETEIMRVPVSETNKRSQDDAWTFKTPLVSCLEVDESPLLQSELQGLQKLWRTRNYRLRQVAGKCAEFLGRYVPHLRFGPLVREGKRERELRAGQLYLEEPKSSDEEQAQQCVCVQPVGDCNTVGSLGAFWNRENDATLPAEKLSRVGFVCNPGRSEQVYDLVNAGDLHRFTVRAENGQPFIVHNCVQATARDILAGGMLRLDHYGYDIVLHVHDEAAAEVLRGTREIEEMNNIMCMKSPWYVDLPLKAAGFKSAYYKKG